MLKRHIPTDHQMTPDDYWTEWGLPPTYSMVAADYAAMRSKLAKDSGLGFARRFCQSSRQNRRHEQYADKSSDRAVMIWCVQPDPRK
jgi:predicted transcriptional regulator